MYCPNCGQEIDNSARFCFHCGAKLPHVIAEADTSSEVAPNSEDAEISAGSSPEPSNEGMASTESNPYLAAQQAEQVHQVQQAQPMRPAARSASHQATGPAGATQVAPMGVHPVPRHNYSLSKLRQNQTPLDAAADLSNSQNAMRVGLTLAAVAFIAIVGIIASVTINAARNAPQSAGQATSQATSAAASGSNDAATTAAATTASAVEPKADPSQYTFAELGQIAAQIESEASSRSQALKIAQSYNLVDANSQIVDVTWTVTTTDGKSAEARLVDVYHDGLADGSGTAALSFITTSPITSARLNATNTNKGGWKDSELRGYLNSEFIKTLPQELQAEIKPVLKATNNTGKSSDASSVTTTSDSLWIPSVIEIAGPVDWSWSSNKTNSTKYNSVINAEGSQYAWYTQEKIASWEDNEVLATGTTCNLRSPSTSVSDHFRQINATGDPSRFGDADKDYGVLLGFSM